MLKAAGIALALASLSACASIGSSQCAPIVGIVAGVAAAPVEVIAPVSSSAPERRRFSLPSDRQPDLHFVLATAADRGRRRLRRRRKP
jgi:hypothetical protein